MSRTRTETKNQHYVPQFLLRGFARPGTNPQDEQRAVAVLNIERNRIIPQAAIRHQCAKSFLYGEDGIVEDALKNLEGRAASVIRNIIKTETPPRHGEQPHLILVTFIAAQYGRTPAAGRELNQQGAAMEWGIRQSARSRGIPEEEIRFDWASLYENKPEAYSLRSAMSSAPIILDLECALLINDTDIDFATNDAGIVLHNPWADGIRGSDGLGRRGVVFFLPISSRFVIILYDSDVYRVRGNPGDVVHLTNAVHVHSLNRLQVNFAEENLYFSGDIKTGQSLRELVQVCQRCLRADSVRSDLFARKGIDGEDVFVLSSEKPSISLSIPWMHVRRCFREIPLHDRVGARPEALRTFDMLRQRRASNR